MCGIVGYWSLKGEPCDRQELEYFTDSLTHRGPDGRGTYFEQSVFLGHRRLAILDLSQNGHQPFTSPCGRYVLTFNGEIYNFIEIKEKLKRQGVSFRTETDTEVLLAAYREWGEDAQYKFNGMWAFAVWDKETRSLFLSRDRFGVKPLYYYFDGKVVAFASELKAFLALRSLDIDWDWNVLSRGLCAPNFIEGWENSLLKNVYNVLPGHCLTVHPNGILCSKRWWNTLDYVDESQVFSSEVFYHHLREACNIRMRSDVPLATALSGGLDSSSIVGMMSKISEKAKDNARIMNDWREAFVASFPGAPEDETKDAHAVANFTGTHLHPFVIRASDAIDNLENITFSFESVFSLPANGWLLYRAMRHQGRIVSLDGHGGDELLAGYHHYPLICMLDALTESPRRILDLKNQYNNAVGCNRGCRKDNVRSHILNFLPREKYTFGHRWLKHKPEDVYYKEPFNSLRTCLQKSLYFDFHYTLLPTILRNFDRVSMAHGVEIRAPFMDWRIVCYGFSLPDKWKINHGYGKYILREAICDMIPEFIRLKKRKLGFVSPFEMWLREGLVNKMNTIIHDKSFINSDIWEGPLVLKEWEAIWANKDFKRMQTFWPFVQAHVLMKTFKDKRNQYDHLCTRSVS